MKVFNTRFFFSIFDCEGFMLSTSSYLDAIVNFRANKKKKSACVHQTRRERENGKVGQGERASRAKRNFSIFRILYVYRTARTRNDRWKSIGETLTKKRKKKKHHVEWLTCSARSFAIIAFPFANAIVSLRSPLHIYYLRDFVQLHRPKLIKYTVGSSIFNYSFPRILLSRPPFNYNYYRRVCVSRMERRMNCSFVNTFKCN